MQNNLLVHLPSPSFSFDFMDCLFFCACFSCARPQSVQDEHSVLKVHSIVLRKHWTWQKDWTLPCCKRYCGREGAHFVLCVCLALRWEVGQNLLFWRVKLIEEYGVPPQCFSAVTQVEQLQILCGVEMDCRTQSMVKVERDGGRLQSLWNHWFVFQGRFAEREETEFQSTIRYGTDLGGGSQVRPNPL